MARVIGRANQPFLQTMILDAGREHHALLGQAVMDARGMIGRIYLAGTRTSWVILLTDLTEINSLQQQVLKTTSPRGMPLESYFPAALQSYSELCLRLARDCWQMPDVSHSQAIVL